MAAPNPASFNQKLNQTQVQGLVHNQNAKSTSSSNNNYKYYIYDLQSQIQKHQNTIIPHISNGNFTYHGQHNKNQINKAKQSIRSQIIEEKKEITIEFYHHLQQFKNCSNS